MSSTFTLENPNAKGTGSALKLTLKPAVYGDPGYIHATIANQVPRGFDWVNSFDIDLTFDILCKMVQVFRGECEDFSKDANGIIERKISMRHIIDDGSCSNYYGYRFTISRKSVGDSNFSHRSFFISSTDSLGICLAIEQSLGLIVFGVEKYV